MRAFNTLQLHIDPPGIATLWLNRPEKHNALNAQMLTELIAAFELLQNQDNLRFVLLRARGKHFSAGADLQWMQQSVGMSYADNLQDAQLLGEMMESLYELSMPTLAVVQGAAFGGALGLIAACDFAIGCASATFCLSEVRIGLTPAVISPYVVQAIGERAMRRYALTAERFDGHQAQRLGLLAECYADAELEAAVIQWQTQLADNSPQAMRVTKALLQEVGSGELSPELRHRTENYIAGVRVSDEGQEGLLAFIEKRTPSWKSS